MSLRPIHVASLLLLATLVLAGCRTVPFEPEVAATFDAQVVSWPGGTPEPQASGLLLPAGSTAYYAIEFGAGRRDLLYAEVVADGPLRVSLLNARGGTLARSTSPEVFPSDASGDFFTAAGDELAPRSISAEFTCLGPCAAIRAIQPMVYIAVENQGSSSRTFDLYAFTMPFSDLNEPNDGPETATPVSGQGTVSGAIETIGDVDWFALGGSSVREVTFFPTSDQLGLRLRIQGSDVSLRYGETAVLYPGERFAVASSIGRAGPSATSGYAVEIGPPITSTFDQIVDAVDSSSPPKLLSRSIAGFATRSYLVRLPTLARDLFYTEVTNADLRVTIKTRSGTPLVASSDPAYFRAAAAGDATVDPSSVGVFFGCLGPCAALRPSSETYLVEVSNLVGSSRSFDLYAFVMDANDENDRRSRTNDARGTATPISGVGDYGGAIEWVGDEDWFRYTGSTPLVLEFTVLDEALGIELVFSGTAGEEPAIRGETGGVVIPLFPEDVFRVASALGRAGPSASSAYFLEVRAP